MKRAGISYFVVAVTNGKVAVLLFDRQRLETYLREEKVWKIFQDMGYQNHAMGKVLYAFRQFEKARDMLIGLLSDGITIAEVVKERLLVHSA